MRGVAVMLTLLMVATVNSGCLASPTPAPGPDQRARRAHRRCGCLLPAAHPRIGDGVSR